MKPISETQDIARQARKEEQVLADQFKARKWVRTQSRGTEDRSLY
jgi:hypothetical protein